MTPTRNRPASLNGAWWAFLGSVALLAVLVALLAWDPARWFTADQRKEPLVVYCAAGLKAPVEEVARQYEAEYGVPVRLQYGGSQTLLVNLEVSKRGDLYLPADDWYIEAARDKGLIDETIPLAGMTPVLAVRPGNPKGLRSLDDLLKDGVRLAQANPDAAAIGKVTRDTLGKVGKWDAVKARTTVFKPTVNDVANDVKVGAVDAGIVWDATVRQYDGLEMVRLPEFDGVQASISVAVLRCTHQPTAALRFARYLTARDRGLPVVERGGFTVVEGDPWAEEPELRLFAGAMLRPAIDETISVFERREGVKVVRVYNGCGILVAQMRAGERPDAYFACDRSFMTQVGDLFQPPTEVSTNRLVILVKKGNPHGIRTLNDLGKPGLKVGVGHEKQCAMGALTQEALKKSGVAEAVMKNVKVQSPTGDMLVNQLRTGSLDAVVAYVSNAAAAADELEAIAIDVPCALAVQPFAVGKGSEHKQLTARLLAAIRSRESRERFEANGFHWQASGKQK